MVLWIQFLVATQWKLWYIISTNIEGCEELEPQTKKIPHYPGKLEGGEENRITYESLFCME